MKRFFDIFILLSLIFVGAAMVIFSGDVSEAVRTALQSCIYTIVPSLFGVTVICTAVSRSGVIGRFFKKSRVEPDVITAALLGNVSGYPVGANILAESVRDGKLSRDEASKALAFSYGAGPAFASGIVGLNVFGDIRLGIAAFLASFLANMTLFAGYLIIKRGGGSEPRKREEPRGFSSAMMVECVRSASRSMVGIVSMILFFSALKAVVFKFWPALSDIPLLLPVLEITALAEYSPSDEITLSTAAVLMSFGGVCVVAQIAASVGDVLSLKYFFMLRPLAMVLSWGYARVISEIFGALGIAAQASTKIRLSQSPSLIPIICVFAMVLITLLYPKKQKPERKNLKPD